MSTPSGTRWLALVLLCMGELMIVLDTTIVNVALPSIRADLGVTATSLAWVVNAYMLTFGGFLLLGGRLGDYFGYRPHVHHRRRPFTPASLACGLAGARWTLIAARAVQGGGAREGDGVLRIRRRRRGSARRAARRRPHRPCSIGTGCSS